MGAKGESQMEVVMKKAARVQDTGGFEFRLSDGATGSPSGSG